MDTIYPAFSISSATRITVFLLIYFAFPLLPAVLNWHYISSHFLFPLLLGSQCVYLFISPFLSFLLSGWSLYIQSFSIFFTTWITVCLPIYFPFPLLPAVLDGHYISSHFLFPLLLRSQSVYLFIFPFLSFLLFGMDTIYPVILYFLCYSDHSESTYLYSLSFTYFCSGWTLYIQSISISSASRIAVCLFIHFTFPWQLAVLDRHYMYNHFLFPLLLGSQCVYLFVSPFLSILLFWMDTIYQGILYFLCYLDNSESTYLFPLSFTCCYSGWTL